MAKKRKKKVRFSRINFFYSVKEYSRGHIYITSNPTGVYMWIGRLYLEMGIKDWKKFFKEVVKVNEIVKEQEKIIKE